MPSREYRNDEYPLWIGMIFVFNLIVGTGALNLPAVFAKAGYILGLCLIILLAFISFVTVTFVIETMACANAIIQWRRLQFLRRDQHLYQHQQNLRQREINNDNNSDSSDDTESLPHESHNYNETDESIEYTPLFSQQSTNYYILDNKIELGQMATLFFNDFGRIVFYLCIAIYLYGDLSIYAAAVSKTLRDVLCSHNQTFNGTDIDYDKELCWSNSSLTRLDSYRVALMTFILLLGPFTFFNVQKTKYIQIMTVLFRWFAFTIMITIAIQRLIVNGREGNPPAANFYGIPSMLGTCVYSFMCHHSLPSLLAPISDKNKIRSLLSIDYILISCFYLCLAFTGAFAFENLQELYTLNFVPTIDQQSIFLKIVEYFLALFPVFTLSTSFPIIAITLRNNLQSLFLDVTKLESYNFLLRRILFPLLAIIPPIFVTFFTNSLTSLVGFTGSYAGAGIQYIIPVCLVYSARRTSTELLGTGILNDYRSPFRNNNWLIFVLVWAIACIIFVTINFFINN